MDQFGIGAGIKGAVSVYLQASRRTGRTTSLVESVKDGDRVVFMDHQQAAHFERLVLDRGVTVECVVVPVDRPDEVFRRGTPKGRTIFDHSWVEAFYMASIGSAMRTIDHLERQSSGECEAHRETRRAAAEMKSGWRPIRNPLWDDPYSPSRTT